MALGFNLVYGTARFFNLAHGVLAAAGGYVVFYLTKSGLDGSGLGLSLIPAIIIGAFLLAFVENFGIWKISGEWKDAIAFAVLILSSCYSDHKASLRNDKIQIKKFLYKID